MSELVGNSFQYGNLSRESLAFIMSFIFFCRNFIQVSFCSVTCSNSMRSWMSLLLGDKAFKARICFSLDT